MEDSILYTVKQGDGYLVIARYIFSKSHRPYIRSLVHNFVLMKEVADAIEADLKHEYLNFKLKPGLKIKLNADPGYYIPRLSIVAEHGSRKNNAKIKANSLAKKEHYFVIHNTAGNMDDTELQRLKERKPEGKGHIYITKDGELIKIWPYNSEKGWATKTEKYKKKSLRGKLVNVELIYGSEEAPSKEQYIALADVYIETNKVFKRWLPITSHREIDRGIPNGHIDPERFNFNYFYSILKLKGVPVDSIEKQGQIRFDQMPWCEHEWTWPPVLTGLKFKRLSKKEQIHKGCKVK